MNPTAHSQPHPKVVQTCGLMGRLGQSPAVPGVGASPLCSHLKRHQQDSTGLLPCSQLRVALSLSENRVWPSVLCAYQEAPHHGGASLAPPFPAWHAGDKEGARGQCRPVGMKGTDKSLDANEWTGLGGHGLSSMGEVSKGASGGGSTSLSPPQERVVTLPCLWERVVFPCPPGSAGLEQT